MDVVVATNLDDRGLGQHEGNDVLQPRRLNEHDIFGKQNQVHHFSFLEIFTGIVPSASLRNREFYILARNTQREQPSLAKVDHYSNINSFAKEAMNAEPWW